MFGSLTGTIAEFQSTHPVGGGTVGGRFEVIGSQFQSTHPVGGGTWRNPRTDHRHGISIHPPRGGWDDGDKLIADIPPISIHPPRGGWDLPSAGIPRGEVISIHPPRGGWDCVLCRYSVYRRISIHPPRGGWDGTDNGQDGRCKHFNPPTPWGVGLPTRLWGSLLKTFQSTHPVGGGTVAGFLCPIQLLISIHPPRGGWDLPGSLPIWDK